MAMQAEQDNDPFAKQEEDDGSTTPLFHDELLRKIGYYACTDSLVQMHRTCRTFRSVMSAPAFIESYIAKRCTAGRCVRTLAQLELVQRMEYHSLFGENRIGFEFASLEIAEDERSQGHDDDGLLYLEGSQSRLVRFQAIAAAFSDATVIIESHCGRAGPRRIAPLFSQERGQIVAERFQHLENPIAVHSWGRNIADVAAVHDHPYGALARCGKGWVELYLELDGVTYPERPPYYYGVALAIEPEDTITTRGMIGEE